MCNSKFTYCEYVVWPKSFQIFFKILLCEIFFASSMVISSYDEIVDFGEHAFFFVTVFNWISIWTLLATWKLNIYFPLNLVQQVLSCDQHGFRLFWVKNIISKSAKTLSPLLTTGPYATKYWTECLKFWNVAKKCENFWSNPIMLCVQYPVQSENIKCIAAIKWDSSRFKLKISLKTRPMILTGKNII